jgi:hypothetical protein
MIIFAKFQSLVAVLGLIDRITRSLQDHGERLADIAFIVGDQYSRL